MADYQKMYTTLFNAVTDAIDILQKAQQETEEIYILTSNPNNTVSELSGTDKSSEHSKP